MTPFLSDQDEDLAPHIAHHVDLMASPDGRSLEFFYNYLVYTFETENERIAAKIYLDTLDEGVNVQSRLAFPLSDFAVKVLAYLALRFGTVSHLTDEGYVPLSDDARQQIAGAVVARTGLHIP